MTRWTDPARWRAERERAFGPAAESFWRWQEETAAALWKVALRGVPWPPQTVGEAGTLAGAGLHMAGRAPLRMPGLAADAFRPLGAHLRAAGAPAAVRGRPTADRSPGHFDARQRALRRGCARHAAPRGGPCTRRHRQARRGAGRRGAPAGRPGAFQAEGDAGLGEDGARLVETSKGGTLRGGCGRLQPAALGRGRAAGPGRSGQDAKAALPVDGWGAFMVYVGLDGSILPADFPLHHQVLVRERSAKETASFFRLACPTMPPASRRALVR